MKDTSHIRSYKEVNCSHAQECFNGGKYGKGCYEDDFNNAMGGKPWQECYCMTDDEKITLIQFESNIS